MQQNWQSKIANNNKNPSNSSNNNNNNSNSSNNSSNNISNTTKPPSTTTTSTSLTHLLPCTPTISNKQQQLLFNLIQQYRNQQQNKFQHFFNFFSWASYLFPKQQQQLLLLHSQNYQQHTQLQHHHKEDNTHHQQNTHPQRQQQQNPHHHHHHNQSPHHHTHLPIFLPPPPAPLHTDLSLLQRLLAEEQDKPTESYIGLIAMAILSSGSKKMVLSDIYKWVVERYPYFRSRGSGWRNSIRHNLSLNECFVKLDRCSSGKGHYWAINAANVSDFEKGDFRRNKALRKAKMADKEKSGGVECCGGGMMEGGTFVREKNRSVGGEMGGWKGLDDDVVVEDKRMDEGGIWREEIKELSILPNEKVEYQLVKSEESSSLLNIKDQVRFKFDVRSLLQK